MMTLFAWPRSYTRDAPAARLLMADVMAARRSASARCRVADIAIRRPSDETAIASITPAVSPANRPSSQLNRWASVLMFCVGGIRASFVVLGSCDSPVGRRLLGAGQPGDEAVQRVPFRLRVTRVRRLPAGTVPVGAQRPRELRARDPAGQPAARRGRGAGPVGRRCGGRRAIRRGSG